MNHQDVLSELRKLGTKERAISSQRYFKTGKGQYGEGDVFLGLTVPEQRAISKKFSNLELNEVKKLVECKEHEARLTGLLILVEQYNKTKNKEIVDFYLEHTNYVNNWDLVDLTAHRILGAYLVDKNRDILYKLAKSNHLWEKRISIVSCFAFIKDNDFKDAIKISEILLNDKHDLIHKAVGWVLREIGKKNLKVEEDFLLKYHKKMPRTMLRYAIEKFDEKKRKFYLAK